MFYYDGVSGFITVITGPMFSEKSGKLIERCQKANLYGKKTFIAFKPEKDNRFSQDYIVSRVGTKIPATNLSEQLTEIDIQNILEWSEKYDIVAFDEAQFFNDKIISVVQELAYKGKQVIIAGLNLNCKGNPIGHIGTLLLMADEIEKIVAYCKCCGSPIASFTQKMKNGKPTIDGPEEEVGEGYEPRCRKCFVPPNKFK